MLNLSFFNHLGQIDLHPQNAPEQPNNWDCSVISVAQTRLATPPESDPSKIAWGLKQDSSLIGTALLLAAKRLIDGGVNPITVEMES